MLAGEGVCHDQPVAEQQGFAAQEEVGGGGGGGGEVGEGGGHARLHAALTVKDLDKSEGAGTSKK